MDIAVVNSNSHAISENELQAITGRFNALIWSLHGHIPVYISKSQQGFDFFFCTIPPVLQSLCNGRPTDPIRHVGYLVASSSKCFIAPTCDDKETYFIWYFDWKVSTV